MFFFHDGHEVMMGYGAQDGKSIDGVSYDNVLLWWAIME